MTWTKKTVTVLGLALAVGVSACDKGLTDVNINPNAPSNADPALLFSTAAISTVGNVRGYYGDQVPQGIGTWAQLLAEYQYPEISLYGFRPTSADGLWSSWYAGPLMDLDLARRQTIASNRPDQTGPILVMRAFGYSIMTGMWGDIPFSEANKGEEKNFTPKYDAQQVVYDSVLKNLSDANTMMTTGTSFGGQDPVYGGDLALWKKFANSLRARVALTLTKKDPSKSAEVVAAITAGGFTSNDDNAAIHWPGDGVNNNPWWNNQAPPAGQGTRDDARSSATLIDTLKALNDPRLQVWFRPVQEPLCGTTALCTDVAPGGYRGMPYGLEASAAGAWGAKSSRLALNVTAADQPSYFMTYAEFLFIRAEARERGWVTTGPTALQLYTDAVTASLEQWGVSAADIATYLAQASVAYPVAGTAADRLHAIGLQKWIAYFMQGVEAWMEWRRTGYPNLAPSLNPRTTGGVIPRRVIYPQTEQSFNNTNLQAAITAQSGAELHQKLWIDP